MTEWRDAFPDKMIRVQDHFWIDPEQVGMLSHLIAGKPNSEPCAQARALCGTVVAGKIVSEMPRSRACARCCDIGRDEYERRRKAENQTEGD